MSFLSSLLCCGGSNPSSKSISDVAADKEPSVRIRVRVHPRTSSIRSNHTGMGRENGYAEPPRYEDVFQQRVVRVDEKDPNIYSIVHVGEERVVGGMQTALSVNDGMQRASTPVPSISDHSSVISIPSTRLSGLTSTYTGNTTRSERGRGRLEGQRTGETYAGSVSVRDSYACSEGDGDLLPGYHAESGVGDRVVLEQEEGHPVMAEGWLDRLRSDAEREGREEWRRR